MKLQLPAYTLNLENKLVAPAAPRSTLFPDTPIVQFARSATITCLPPPNECSGEVAFAGRSNAGKSTLLNALTKTLLARTSKTPGRTQLVNYFQLTHRKPGPHLVDLPGYGFGQASEATLDSWNMLMGEYIRVRHEQGFLKRVYLLLDSRRGVMPLDCEFISFLSQHNVPFQVVMTKVDRIPNETELHAMVSAILMAAKTLNAPSWLSPVYLVSAEAKTGLKELRLSVEAALSGV